MYNHSYNIFKVPTLHQCTYLPYYSSYPTFVYYVVFGLAVIFPKHFGAFCTILASNQSKKLHAEKNKEFKRIGQGYYVQAQEGGPGWVKVLEVDRAVDKHAQRYEVLKESIKVNDKEMAKVSELGKSTATYEVIGNTNTIQHSKAHLG